MLISVPVPYDWESIVAVMVEYLGVKDSVNPPQVENEVTTSCSHQKLHKL